MNFSDLMKESLRSGSIASIAMMPVGSVFKSLHLRVGHYGPKLAETLFGNPPEILLFAQHLAIGCLSAIPLLLALTALKDRVSPILVGTGYGVGYYLLVNSLALPLAFGDPTPWELGLDFVYPSLVVHIVFGASIGLTSRKFVRAHAAD